MSTGPLAEARPAIAQTIPQIQGAYNTERSWRPYGSYTGPAVAGFTDQQRQGMDEISRIAQSGGGVTGGALDEVGRTLSGQYLNFGNPSFGLMARRIRNQVQPELTSQWAMAGRGTGNDEAPEAVARGLGDAIGALAYQNYGDERGRMMQAAGMAPGLDAARYADAERLYGVGELGQQMNQANIGDQIYRAQYEQQQPSQALDQQIRRLTQIGSMGQEGTGTTTATPSGLQVAAGLGLAGAGLMSGNPMMAMGGLMGGSTMPGTAANGGWSTTTRPAWGWRLPWMQG